MQKNVLSAEFAFKGADLTEGLDHIWPILVALADSDPRILAFLEPRQAETLEIELNHPFAELANPVAGLDAILHHVAAIEVPADDRRFEGIDVLDELLWL